MTKKALISPNETNFQYTSSWEQVDGEFQPVYTEIQNAQRIAQVEEEANIFEVAPPLYWKDCAESVKSETHYLDTTNDTITKLPEDAIKPTE
jgi:hypothetical protein